MIYTDYVKDSFYFDKNCIGTIGATGALCYGLVSMVKGDSKMSQYAVIESFFQKQMHI